MSIPVQIRLPSHAHSGVSPVVVGTIGFLTLVDLFATQAILPALAHIYRVTPAQIGLAANASTLGMATAGLLAGVLGDRVERRRVIVISLAALSLPTLALAIAPSLAVFALLRVAQGLCMATAFTLTIAYLNERCTATGVASALAAYVTGGVASNLVGRLVAAGVTGSAGTATNFVLFAALNLAGAGLAGWRLTRTAPMQTAQGGRGPFGAALSRHLGDRQLQRCFAVGFLILFAFIGTFSYVGFVLARPPIALSMTAIGFVFLCFVPSMVTTPLAGRVVRHIGAPWALSGSLLLALMAVPLLSLSALPAILAGLTLVGIGTFFAQAVATGSVGRFAAHDRAAASGLYLGAYYGGGLAGVAIIGRLFDAFGWNTALVGIGSALGLAVLLGARLNAEGRP